MQNPREGSISNNRNVKLTLFAALFSVVWVVGYAYIFPSTLTEQKLQEKLAKKYYGNNMEWFVKYRDAGEIKYCGKYIYKPSLGNSDAPELYIFSKNGEPAALCGCMFPRFDKELNLLCGKSCPPKDFDPAKCHAYREQK